jgi:hypothetical protein
MSIHNPENLTEVNEMCQWGLTPEEIDSVENEFVLSAPDIQDLVECPIVPKSMMAQLCRSDQKIQKFTTQALIAVLERRNFERIMIQVA